MKKPRLGENRGFGVLLEDGTYTADHEAIRYLLNSTTIVLHAVACGQRHKGKERRPKPTPQAPLPSNVGSLAWKIGGLLGVVTEQAQREAAY
jgi:hypothetical protein